MNIRKTAVYKRMSGFHAIEICEGFGEGEGASQDEAHAAWQYLIDTGRCWHLQGWYGRTANDLIEQGLCKAAKVDHTDYYGNLVPAVN